MFWKNILAAVCLMLCLGLGQTAAAQESGNFPFPPEAPEADPSPVNPAQKMLESGKVMVVVGSSRHFGYRIGEVIPVTIVISADPTVKVNLDSLKRKVLAAEGSDFEMAEAPHITSEELNGKTVYRVQLWLRSWVGNKPALVLNAEFFYATDMLPDQKTPLWKAGNTPNFVVTTSNTAIDSAKELLDGDMKVKASPRPWVATPLKYAGVILFLALPAWLIWCVWRRARPVRFYSRAEKAWLNLDAILQASQSGWKYEHFKAASETLREYLRIPSVATDQAEIPLEEFFAGSFDQDDLKNQALSTLSKLDRVLYSQSELSTEECAELANEFKRLVPRS